MKIRKILALVLVALTVVSLLASCKDGSGDTGEKTMTVSVYIYDSPTSDIPLVQYENYQLKYTTDPTPVDLIKAAAEARGFTCNLTNAGVLDNFVTTDEDEKTVTYSARSSTWTVKASGAADYKVETTAENQPLAINRYVLKDGDSIRLVLAGSSTESTTDAEETTEASAE